MSMNSKTAVWTARILHALVVLAFLPGGVMKIMHHPTVVEGVDRIGIPQSAILPIGMIELLCVAVYLLPRTAVLGTLLLTGYLGGATMANIVGGTDFLHALAVGLLVWAGAWLRVPELRELVPIRTGRRSEGAARSAAVR